MAAVEQLRYSFWWQHFCYKGSIFSVKQIWKLLLDMQYFVQLLIQLNETVSCYGLKKS